MVKFYFLLVILYSVKYALSESIVISDELAAILNKCKGETTISKECGDKFRPQDRSLSKYFCCLLKYKENGKEKSICNPVSKERYDNLNDSIKLLENYEFKNVSLTCDYTSSNSSTFSIPSNYLKLVILTLLLILL